MAHRLSTRQLQADLHESAMANLETSAWWVLDDEALEAIKHRVASNKRLNQSPVAQITEIQRRRALATCAAKGLIGAAYWEARKPLSDAYWSAHERRSRRG